MPTTMKKERDVFGEKKCFDTNKRREKRRILLWFFPDTIDFFSWFCVVSLQFSFFTTVLFSTDFFNRLPQRSFSTVFFNSLLQQYFFVVRSCCNTTARYTTKGCPFHVIFDQDPFQETVYLVPFSLFTCSFSDCEVFVAKSMSSRFQERQKPTGKQLSNQLLPSNDLFLSTSCRTRGSRGRWTRQTKSRILSFLFFMKILVSIWFFFDGCRYIYILDSIVSFPLSFHFLSCSSFHQIKNNRGTKNGPDSGCDDHLFLLVFFSCKELVSDIISFRLYLFR